MKRRTVLRAGAAALALSFSGTLAHAQDTVKIGLILPMTGPFASTGRQIEAAAKLYMQQNGDTVAGTHRSGEGRRAGRLRADAAGAGNRAARHPGQGA
jgi:ABC-type sugar transport system substrate-binding protein